MKLTQQTKKHKNRYCKICLKYGSHLQRKADFEMFMKMIDKELTKPTINLTYDKLTELKALLSKEYNPEYTKEKEMTK